MWCCRFLLGKYVLFCWLRSAWNIMSIKERSDVLWGMWSKQSCYCWCLCWVRLTLREAGGLKLLAIAGRGCSWLGSWALHHPQANVFFPLHCHSFPSLSSFSSSSRISSLKWGLILLGHYAGDVFLSFLCPLVLQTVLVQDACFAYVSHPFCYLNVVGS